MCCRSGNVWAIEKVSEPILNNIGDILIGGNDKTTHNYYIEFPEHLADTFSDFLYIFKQYFDIPKFSQDYRLGIFNDSTCGHAFFERQDIASMDYVAGSGGYHVDINADLFGDIPTGVSINLYYVEYAKSLKLKSTIIVPRYISKFAEVVESAYDSQRAGSDSGITVSKMYFGDLAINADPSHLEIMHSVVAVALRDRYGAGVIDTDNAVIAINYSKDHSGGATVVTYTNLNKEEWE